MYEPFQTTMRVLYDKLIPPQQRLASSRHHRITRGPPRSILVFIFVFSLFIQCTMCVVQGPTRHRYHKTVEQDETGAREVGSLIIHHNRGVNTQGSEVSYSISVENNAEDSKYYNTQSNNSRPIDNQDISDGGDEDDEMEEPNDQPPPSPRQIRWADAAHQFVEKLDCSEVFFTTERECRNLKRQSKSDMTVHIADPTHQGRLATVLPDGGLSKSGLHDAVVVLDPYPAANYGHLVLVFYVDLHMGGSWCKRQGGKFLGEWKLC